MAEFPPHPVCYLKWLLHLTSTSAGWNYIHRCYAFNRKFNILLSEEKTSSWILQTMLQSFFIRIILEMMSHYLMYTGLGKKVTTHISGVTRIMFRLKKRVRDIRNQLEGLLDCVEIEMTFNSGDIEVIPKAITSGYFPNFTRLDCTKLLNLVKLLKSIWILV